MMCGCGRVGFDELPAGDGGTNVVDASKPPIDADLADATARIATGPFDSVALVPELSDPTLDDDDPTLTADMLEIYFKRDTGPPSGLDIFMSTRPSVDDPWTAPIRVEELSTSDDDNTPEVSADGLTMHFTSNRDGNNDVYVATRTSRGEPWGTPERVAELSSGDQDFAACTDGSGLVLTMTRIIGGNPELFEAIRPSTAAAWGTPELVPELNTERYEADAVLDITGLRIFYTAVLEDATVGREVLTAIRPSVSEPFDAPEPLMGVNTADDDEDPWLSPDMATMYFVRRTATGQDIYVATRPLDP